MRRRSLALLAVPFLGSWIHGCGGVTELDELTPEESCRAAEGASWGGDGCNGGADLCDWGVCETAIGEGCRCSAPGMCWDGSACVEGTSYENSFEPSPS